MSESLDSLPFPISLVANVLFGLSMLLDTGMHDGISIDEVKQHAKAGDLIEFLQGEGGGYFASNIFDSFPVFRKWYSEQIAANCQAMEGRERRKCGIENRGLCLLVSYTAEIIQQNKAPLYLANHQRFRENATK